MLKVREGSLDEVVKINNTIPEFENHFSKKYLSDRLIGKKSLIAIGTVDNKLAGFSICWSDNLNSWVERWVLGVNPKFRKQGVMKAMVAFEEEWGRKQKMKRIRSDINNKRKEMLLANIKLGYSIIGVEFDNDLERTKVFFEKKL